LKIGTIDQEKEMKATNGEDILLSNLAQAIGEPARTRMLLSLLDGHARTSTELATLADVAPSTASAHLNRLKDAKLIRVVIQGRHRYYSLYGPEVAAVIERLGVLSGRTTKRFVPKTPEELRRARSCYDHMAGAVAVALHDQFLRERWLVSDGGSGSDAYQLSDAGTQRLEWMGIDLEEVRSLRRRFAYPCLDWSERRPHIAGALGAALLRHAAKKGWVVRELDSRALRLTRTGQKNILEHFGIAV
jgi:DNA-binding transcriptional ArsR family regulator